MKISASPEPPLISLRDLTVDFEDRDGFSRALHGVSLNVSRGEALGIVGESGCGKSITWMACLGLLGRGARIGGSASFRGENLIGATDRRISQIRGKKIAMIFQDPSSSLNPLLRIGTQLCEALALHQGLRGGAAKAEAVRLLDRVGITNAVARMGAYPHELSGGMNQRVMIAMALAGKPEVLVADEPTTALDATIQAQILTLLESLRLEERMGLVLISHDLEMVAEMTDRVLVMYAGRIVEDSPTDALFDAPAHPYTRGLIGALPDLMGPIARLSPVRGTVPSPKAMPSGCAFAPRCPEAFARCGHEVPSLCAVGSAHLAACHALGASQPQAVSGEAVQ